MSDLFSGWNTVEAAAKQVVRTSTEPFETKTVLNVRDLLAVCRCRSPLPEQIGKGYWNTLIISWSDFQLEVFEDRIEIYRFRDRETNIREELHQPGQDFSKRFLDELSGLFK